MYPYQAPFEETHYYYDPYNPFDPYAERQQQAQGQQQQQQQTYQQLLNILMSSIIGEATAIDFYTRLAKDAPNEYSKNVLLSAAKDEKAHLHLFTRLYTSLTGKEPKYKIRPVKITNFRQSLFEAYEDELSDYEKYRNAYLLTQDPSIRDTFFRPFSDEIKHATRFSFLLNAR
ncbi:ferritin-like domain-containing protein [Fictibacillus terranigra]|uniref:Ferritin-like domain-containing protein n=1 Tax=Fictibacillus terranigra TaxID=3058424 RepID=A0ABT8EAA7_9BACL|nr:ferritin-like domain-containing protein [Fictibacillus sp. CENA-BCM004]MDN4074851.1 ferritin-like domain-containing protein [Fictibacillus sp. CENA-BCM004]